MPTDSVPADLRPSGGPLAIDVQLLTDLSATKDRAEQLAEVGVDGLFTFEGQHDVFFPLVLAAECGLDLMTNVAIAFPRSPMHLANSAYDLAALSGGRFRLGLGTQIRPHIERRYGATWSRPVARMREIVLATKAILRHWQGEAPLEFRGEFFTHTLMTPNFNPGPLSTGVPPIHVGALGPQMTRMTASVADGVLVMPFNSRRHLLERTVPALQQGLQDAHRTRSELEVICEIICAVGETDAEIEAASAGVRSLLSFYGSTPSYRPTLEVEGREDLQPTLNAMSKQGRWQEMSELIDDQLLETIAVRGTPTQCAKQIVDRVGDLADRVCLYFPGYPLSDRVLADVVTAVKAASANR